MSYPTAAGAILAAWNSTASYIASGHVAEFSGRSKEGFVFRHVKQSLEKLSPGIEVALKVPFEGWEIDLVVSLEAEHVAVEGKFKLRSDGAVPDNRKLHSSIFTSSSGTLTVRGIREGSLCG